MALEEHDREDLLRDGRMMLLRGEVDLDDVTMLLGFRREGQVSLYFGPERVFQFDKDGRLRRAFFDGRKFAANAGRLVQLSRQSRGGRVEMTRQDVDQVTTLMIFDAAADNIKRLNTVICDNKLEWRVVGTSGAEFRDRVKRWLETIPLPLQISAAAGA